MLERSILIHAERVCANQWGARYVVLSTRKEKKKTPFRVFIRACWIWWKVICARDKIYAERKL